jgi:biopolymer transport protein ExbD
MGFNPSARMKAEEEEELNLNLNPMMDMFAVLIPALLMMSTVVEVAIIDISAPSIGPPPPGKEQPKPDAPPLNLKITIMESGYLVTSSVGPAPGGAPEPDQKVTFPLIDKTVLCSKYRGTVPPPRNKNKDRQKCSPDKPLDKQPFIVYDIEALHGRIMDFKNAYPSERRVIVEAGADIQYESVVDVMDMTRDHKEASGELRPLFDEIVVSPGMQ